MTKKGSAPGPCAAEPQAEKTLKDPLRISDAALAQSRRKGREEHPPTFGIAHHPPGVVPKDAPTMAQDSQIAEVNGWAGQIYGAIDNGFTFLGYPELSALAQRPEYRRISEVLATEATRKWIKVQSKTDTGIEKGKRVADPKKAERVQELTAELKRLDAQGAFRKLIELDGFFGRSHLLIDTGQSDSRDEMITPIGDGRSDVTLAKFKGRKGFLEALKPIEPVWCYPARYNATNPLLNDWYNPRTWFVQGVEVDRTRLICFVGREVPDLLKPSYAFGGLSLSQMAKPYVDNWLRTRQSIADLIWSFSVRVLKTDLSTLMMQDGDQLFRRIAMFANIQTNQGVMALDKDKEDFDNIVTPLGSLDALQAQAQEHMCSVTGTPVVKLLGIQPAGLNASSAGELEVWYDWVEAFQEKFIGKRLHEVMGFVMLSLWGEIDDDITFAFEELRAQSKKEEAETRKLEAETDIGYIEAQVLAPTEVRARLASDPDSPYDGIEPDDVPDAGEEDDDVFTDQDVPNLGGILSKVGASSERDPGIRDDRGRTREPTEREDAPDRGARRETRIRERA